MRNETKQFQHTAARRRLRRLLIYLTETKQSFNTQPPEGGCVVNNYDVALVPKSVSTHSRPKAAAHLPGEQARVVTGFNTQPPEGGCIDLILIK